MKTTQNHKVIFFFFKIFFIVTVIFCVYKVAEVMYDFCGVEEIEYEDASHVLEIFEENKSDFDAMVDVLKDTNINRILFDDYMDNPEPIIICAGDALSNPKYQIRRRDLLEKEDYKAICRFFKKYGPVCIEGTIEFRFDFDMKDGMMYLFYIPNKKRRSL